MHKLFFLFLLFIFITSVSASEKIQIYAQDIKSIDDKVIASGGINVVYKKYIISAKKAIYYRDSGDLELYDNIRVASGDNYKILGRYAKLNIKKKEKLFRPFYMYENTSKVWLSAGEGESNSSIVNINNGVISGCNPINPLWKMEFTSSDYNTDTKWINLYNARIYIEDIPVFYLPYFGYSLDTKRKTGFLVPAVGYSQSEGVYYEQPIYIAPQNWWDLELKPQLRTSRGKGIYETFRFVDSSTSKGEFKAGYFKENVSYFKENNLQNDSHYGFNFKYDNNDFINQWLKTDLSGQAGLYADINYMNDVDYINLSSNDTLNNTTATQVLSRINTFYNIDNHYIGAYFKYYQDLTKVSNQDTAQILPTLQYHYYLDTFFKDHLMYSLDVKSNNIQRGIGEKVLQTDINLPVTIQTSLFDEYLNISYKANLYLQNSVFSGVDTNTPQIDYDDGYYFRNYHTLSASSQLTKGYENYSHVVSLGVSYNREGSDSKNGFYEDMSSFCSNPENMNDPKCEFYNISPIKDEAKIDFIQYLYDASSNEILYHRLSQNISYSTEDRYGELENELDYKMFSFLSLYNNMFYNYDQNLFSKIFNKISFHMTSVNLSFSHLYKDNFLDKEENNIRYTSYITSSIDYMFDSHYSFSGAYNYDIELKNLKSGQIGFMYKQRCWDFGIKYLENNRPILTQDGLESSIFDRYIYVTIVLKPVMKPSNSSFLTFQLPK